MPPSQSRKLEAKQALSAHRAEVRRELEERYKALFGCSVELAPWGRPWSDVLEEARTADRRYLVALRALNELQAVLERACKVVAQTGHAREPYTFESRIGLTLPEAVLCDWFLDPAMHLGVAYVRIPQQLEYLRRAGIDAAMHESRFVGSLEDAEKELEQGGPPKLMSYEAARDRWHDAARLVGTSRRLAAIPAQLAYGRVEEGLQMPPLLGHPPDGADAAEPETWRRGYLVELLDTYPLTPKPSSSVPFRFPSDTELAVVNLLLGGLDVVTAERLRAGTREVVDRERRAIKETRRRRAIMTELLRRGGSSSDCNAPSNEAAVERSSNGVEGVRFAPPRKEPRRPRK